MLKPGNFKELFLKCCSCSVYTKTLVFSVVCVCTQKACSFGFSVFSAVKWSYWYNQHSLLRTNHKGQFVSLCSFGIHANAEPRQYRHTCLQAPFSDWFIGNPRQVTEALLKLICRVGGKCRSQRVRIEWGTCNYLTFILKCILYKRWEQATKFLKQDKNSNVSAPMFDAIATIIATII